MLFYFFCVGGREREREKEDDGLSRVLWASISSEIWISELPHYRDEPGRLRDMIVPVHAEALNSYSLLEVWLALSIGRSAGLLGGHAKLMLMFRRELGSCVSTGLNLHRDHDPCSKTDLQSDIPNLRKLRVRSRVSQKKKQLRSRKFNRRPEARRKYSQ